MIPLFHASTLAKRTSNFQGNVRRRTPPSLVLLGSHPFPCSSPSCEGVSWKGGLLDDLEFRRIVDQLLDLQAGLLPKRARDVTNADADILLRIRSQIKRSGIVYCVGSRSPFLSSIEWIEPGWTVHRHLVLRKTLMAIEMPTISLVSQP